MPLPCRACAVPLTPPAHSVRCHTVPVQSGVANKVMKFQGKVPEQALDQMFGQMIQQALASDDQKVCCHMRLHTTCTHSNITAVAAVAIHTPPPLHPAAPQQAAHAQS